MNATINKITRLTCKKVSYYTVQIDDKDDEFNDFLRRMSAVPEYAIELGEIIQYILEIGNIHGAKTAHFRHERAAEALPPEYHKFLGSEENQYGLRLYCIRLTNSAVILLNGDMKTNLYPDKCDNCKKHFELANKLSKKIDEAIVNKEIFINDQEIEFTDDFEINL